MKAIILAAGYGKRIHPVTNGLPKSMLQIGDKSLLHHMIGACLRIGIEDFVFVLGYEIDKMKTHIGEVLESFTVVYNPDYRTTNTIYSLWLARENFDDDFLYFNADILFDPKLLDLIKEDHGYPELLLETKRCAEEEVKMVIDNDYRILEIGKKLDPKDCAGEFIGIGKFTRNVLPDFAECLQQGVDQKLNQNYFEWAVDLLAKKHKLIAVPTQDYACIEIDFPEDYQRAVEDILPRIGS